MLRLERLALLSLGLVGFVAFQLQVADGYCPNGCNAQGTCGKNDKCTCYLRQDEESSASINIYPAYKGADCSERTCPYGQAWVFSPNSMSGPHEKVECSNKGNCDIITGHCECYPGYEGKACERTVCPNGCNGRGICLTLKSIVAARPSTLHADGVTIVPPVSTSYTAWDAEKHMGCFCDQGFRGPDCSLKECPSGPDVLLSYGSAEGRDCGGRGKCNYEIGDCECFPGYYGTACESQTTVH